MDDISRRHTDEEPPSERRRAKGPAEEQDAQWSGEVWDRELAEVPAGAPRIASVVASRSEVTMEAADGFEPGEGARPDQPDPGGEPPAPESDRAPEASEAPAAEAAAPAADDGLDAGDDHDDELPELQDPEEIGRVLLAVLLVAKEAVSLLRLAQICKASQSAIADGLDALQASLLRAGLPVEVSRVDQSVRLLTRPEVFPYLKRLRKVKKAERLSPAALETLAVVAYRQPVMRAEVEAIRGVKVGPTLRTLLEHKLIDMVGRADVPGRPLQYGTTQTFLDRFGLASLKDLPSVREFKSLK